MSRRTITDVAVIAAPVERVWDLTVDVERWPTLTSTITSVQRLDPGPLAVGSRARITQPAQRPAVWTVDELVTGERFRWSTKLGWLRMTGGHRLEAVPEGCRNTLTLEIEGFGAGVAAALVGRAMGKAIATENEGFKVAAEGTGADEVPGPAA